MSDPESIIRQKLAQLLDVEADRIALDADHYREHGMTSLKPLLLLMTSLCAETGTSVFKFSEEDIARPKTPRDIAAMF